ncbi:MAG: UMP kinase [Patescibacteria group bacterium]|jgi:uridylate kinase|nr:UMP kinase [Patescibacteria group bacterium]
MAKTLVMSLGGSLIAPQGIDLKFLVGFRKLILDFTAQGNRVIIITGGGDTARNYQSAARKINAKISPKDLDWVGIAATKINGELVSAIFGNLAYEGILADPSRKVKTNKKIIVGAGFKPGSSSDKDAVIAARTFGAKTVINLSNISYVYNKDPRKHKDAKPQTKMTWSDFRKIIGNKYIPGAHWPFDPVASRLAQQWQMSLVVMKGSDLANLRNFLADRKFKGTIIE